MWRNDEEDDDQDEDGGGEEVVVRSVANAFKVISLFSSSLSIQACIEEKIWTFHTDSFLLPRTTKSSTISQLLTTGIQYIFVFLTYFYRFEVHTNPIIL